jgi:hypothetical protein
VGPWAWLGEWGATTLAKVAADVLDRYLERKDRSELARLRLEQQMDRLAILVLEWKARTAGRDLTLRVRADGGVIELPGDDPGARSPAPRDPVHP